MEQGVCIIEYFGCRGYVGYIFGIHWIRLDTFRCSLNSVGTGVCITEYFGCSGYVGYVLDTSDTLRYMWKRLDTFGYVLISLDTCVQSSIFSQRHQFRGGIIKAMAIGNLSFWVVFGSRLKCSWHYGQVLCPKLQDNSRDICDKCT